MKDNKKWVIGGLQQIGVGVYDNEDTWSFYREMFGFDIPMFDDTGIADIMAPYMGGKAWERHAVFAINIRGGGGLEIWQYTNRNPKQASQEVSLQSRGIIAVHIRCKNIYAIRAQCIAKKLEVSEPSYMPDGRLCFFVRDIGYNWICLIETNEGWFIPPKNTQSKKQTSTSFVGGVCGAMIGVSDMDASIEFYQKICGYDTIVYDIKGVFHEFDIFLHQQKIRRVLLKSTATQKGLFAHLLTSSNIELIEATGDENGDGGVHVFEDRYWGDPGFIHICFDVRGMDALKQHCEAAGYPFSIDTGEAFHMDDASGRFAYVEDPDGTLIEFVEVYKMPIIQKIGLVLNVKNKALGLVLPKIMLKLLQLRRKK